MQIVPEVKTKMAGTCRWPGTTYVQITRYRSQNVVYNYLSLANPPNRKNKDGGGMSRAFCFWEGLQKYKVALYITRSTFSTMFSLTYPIK